MGNNEKNIRLKLVDDICGSFFVPAYQRGYRWGEAEITRLLDDLIKIKDEQMYCLQPIVVKRNSDSFEVIDGQQRLTTIYLIYKCICDFTWGFAGEPKFDLTYETRMESGNFLVNMNFDEMDKNIDFWFMGNAYKSIKSWFEKREDSGASIRKISDLFKNNVQVIWYEVGENEDAIQLFTRLNIGKIPLTSAELVKAMFLSREGRGEMTRERQEEIALEWDNIEKELNEDDLWYFLTNKEKKSYQTKIDLVLDLISGKNEDEMDKYFTFFEFDKMRKHTSLEDVWRDIELTFLSLKDWHEDHELYHKVGYLIASEYKNLMDIYILAKDKTKKEFRENLDDYIKKSIALGKGENFADLSYEKKKEAKKLSDLLLLFNVESVRRSAERTARFPFHKLKYGDGGKVRWSLEHIHAQRSEGLKTTEARREWLKKHLESIKVVAPNDSELIERIVYSVDKNDYRDFGDLQQKIVDTLSEKGSIEHMHSIANLALLNAGDNAVLNNSTFDVKRNDIIDMDKSGKFIPFCTRMVFLKYYTPSEKNQLHFWGYDDRVAYVDAINSVLYGDDDESQAVRYLEEKIRNESEDK